MRTATVPLRTINYDDFFRLVEDGHKADLIDGEIHMSLPDNIEANELNGWLYSIMSMYVVIRNLGKVYFSRVACRLDDHNAPEPDILFVATAHLHRLHRGGLEGPPDLAMEIVSPDSVERDYKKKRKQYAKFGVPEYWIIDEMEQQVLLLRLGDKGKYREVRPRKGVFHSAVMKGFWLRPEWLWPTPRPIALEILQQLLDG